VSHAFAGLARQDLAAARAWADRLEGDDRDAAASGLVGVWAAQDPQMAGEWLFASGDRFASQHMWQVVNQYTRADAEGAVRWVSSLSPDQARFAIPPLAHSLGEQDIRAAANLIERLPAGDLRDQARMQLAGVWAAQDPLAALDWAGRFDDSMRANVTALTLGSLALRDRAAALMYLDRLDVGPERDQATLSIITGSSDETDPVQAIELARDIGDAEMRTRADWYIYYQLLGRSEPEQAEAYRRERGLPDPRTRVRRR
jgi:hypothetical protein